jgi:hypothetical protein
MKLRAHLFHLSQTLSATTAETAKYFGPLQCVPQMRAEGSPQQPMPSKISTIATSKLRREMPKPRQILSKPSVAPAAAPTMTHPKPPLIQPDQNAGGPCGSIIDMPTRNTITQPAIDSVAAILILSFHHAIPAYPFRYGLDRTGATQSAFRISQFDANSGTLLETKAGEP